MTEFNKETFVTDYIEALKANNLEELISLINSLENDEDRAVALDGVIEAIKADEELAATADKTLEALEDAKAKNEAKAAEANAGADVEVSAPSIKVEEVASEEVAEEVSSSEEEPATTEE